MNLQFEHKNELYPVELQQQDQQFEVTIGDKTHTAEVINSSGAAMQVRINGKKYQVHFAAKQDERYLTLNGRNFILKRISDRQKAKQGQSASAQDLIAPMPGKVLKIHVANGDIVEEGQPLLILEAMKMEYTIKAHRSGEVVGLSLSEGDQVDMGQVLLDVTGEESE